MVKSKITVLVLNIKDGHGTEIVEALESAMDKGHLIDWWIKDGVEWLE